MIQKKKVNKKVKVKLPAKSLLEKIKTIFQKQLRNSDKSKKPSLINVILELNERKYTLKEDQHENKRRGYVLGCEEYIMIKEKLGSIYSLPTKEVFEKNKYLLLEKYKTKKSCIFIKKEKVEEKFNVENGLLGLKRDLICGVVRQIGINSSKKIRQVFQQ
jgi:hypothetical protein